jgi:hypothetical protein
MTKENDDSKNDVVDKLVEISKKIDKLEHERSVHLKATHGRFNLFTTLLKSHDEVRLHGRYLTHLLNPNAKHDCGHLFLNLFLKKVGLEDLQDQKCSVKAEKYAGKILGLQSYIDIYIEFEDAAIVIENKILAGDQEKQLERYSIFAKERRRKSNVHVFYLTLDGHEPSEYSVGDLDKEKVNVRYISYGAEILNWLEQCLEKSYASVNINQSLLQYRSVINGLLGNTLEKKDMNEIKNEIKKFPSVIKNAHEIIRAFGEIQDDCVNTFFRELTSALVSANGDFSIEKVQGNIEKPTNTKKTNVRFRLIENVEIEYRPKEKRIFVGAYLHYKKKRPDLVSHIEKTHEQHPEIEYDKEAWGFRHWLLDKRSFGSNNLIAQMVNEGTRKNIIDECVKEICDFVEKIEGDVDNPKLNN